MTAPSTVDVAAIQTTQARLASHGTRPLSGSARQPGDDAQAVADTELRSAGPGRDRDRGNRGSGPASCRHAAQRTRNHQSGRSRAGRREHTGANCRNFASRRSFHRRWIGNGSGDGTAINGRRSQAATGPHRADGPVRRRRRDARGIADRRPGGAPTRPASGRRRHRRGRTRMMPADPDEPPRWEARATVPGRRRAARAVRVLRGTGPAAGRPQLAASAAVRAPRPRAAGRAAHRGLADLHGRRRAAAPQASALSRAERTGDHRRTTPPATSATADVGGAGDAWWCRTT